MLLTKVFEAMKENGCCVKRNRREEDNFELIEKNLTAFRNVCFGFFKRPLSQFSVLKVFAALT